MRFTRTLLVAAVVASATACSSTHHSASSASSSTAVASGSTRPTSPTAAPTSLASDTGSPGLASAPASAGAAHATESNPPGDIPDTTVFVPYQMSGVAASISVPEGWAQSTAGAAVTFTDKLNSIVLTSAPAASAPTVATAKQVTVPQLQGTVPAFKLLGVSTVQRKAGTAVLVHFEADSAPNPVTGKVIRDDVQRFEFFHGTTEVDVTLSGPVNADNVDPWKTVTDSFQWK